MRNMNALQECVETVPQYTRSSSNYDLSVSELKECVDSNEFAACGPLAPASERSVRFDTTVRNRRIPHLNELTKEEILATWITTEEYLDIRKRCIMTVKRMMRGLPDDKEYCSRGLEGKTKEGAARRKESKLDSIAAVLEEQCLQWGEDVEDHESLMEVYLIYSYPSRDVAHHFGLMDEAAAKEYYFGTPMNTTPPNESGDNSTVKASQAPTKLLSKLSDIMCSRSSRVALLDDIEKHFSEEVYDDVSIDRRARKPEGDVPVTIATQLQAIYHARSNRQAVLDDLERKYSPKQSDLLDHIDTSRCSLAEANEEMFEANDSFTTQLRDIFYSRKKRQDILDEIEKVNYFNGYPGKSHRLKSLVSHHFAAKLKEFFCTKRKRQAVLNDIDSSFHKRQHCAAA